MCSGEVRFEKMKIQRVSLPHRVAYRFGVEVVRATPTVATEFVNPTRMQNALTLVADIFVNERRRYRGMFDHDLDRIRK
jgi:hypothetical protein